MNQKESKILRKFRRFSSVLTDDFISVGVLASRTGVIYKSFSLANVGK